MAARKKSVKEGSPFPGIDVMDTMGLIAAGLLQTANQLRADPTLAKEVAVAVKGMGAEVARCRRQLAKGKTTWA